ncbi:uncharacterized protein LOC143237334 isoform X4 [Tachypleus tridentatus]|uniref:uncharacterized protein LOC143237334 isoform X4 n=1 Tax=Tachypleus tridentatus TaxID=6853 RepID=UPI003FCFEEA6
MKMKHLHYQVKKLVPYKKDLSTNLKSGLVKEEQEDKYGVTEKTENIFVTMKTEQSDDLTQSEVISKFSKSTDDDLDSSKCGVINVKIETELQEDVQCVDSRLESTSDVKSSVNICCGSQFPEKYVLKQDVHGKNKLNWKQHKTI